MKVIPLKICAAIVLLAACTQEDPCPHGTARAGSRCLAAESRDGEAEAESDGAVTDADSSDAELSEPDAGIDDAMVAGGAQSGPTVWEQRGGTVQDSPSAPQASGVAYDSVRNRLVMFGGFRVGKGLDETWEWDGTSWEQKHPLHRPPPHVNPLMVFDESRERVVLLDSTVSHSIDGPGLMLDGNTEPAIWEWDGTDWVFVPVEAAPATYMRELEPARIGGAAIAYNSRRGTIVVLGTIYEEARIWELDGTTWSMPWHQQRHKILAQGEVAPPLEPYPPVLEGGTRRLAYDRSRDRMVLIGNVPDPFGAGWFGTTWEWDGKAWTEVGKSVANPPARFDFVLLYDQARARTLLLGGTTRVRFTGTEASPTPLQDAWAWDGSTWQKLADSTPPGVRVAAAATYDPEHHRVLIFGGKVPATSNDFWSWDGTDWNGSDWDADRSNPSPGIITGHALAYDTRRAVTVLFGGVSRESTIAAGSAELAGATWEWDGVVWHERQATPAPAPRSGPGMVFDAARERTVLFGGTRNSEHPNDTWEWDGTRWIEREVEVAPPASSGVAMAYDESRKVTVLFGGAVPGGHSNETWEWDGSEWTKRSYFDGPRARSDAAMAYDSVRNRVVLFGGMSSGELLNDLWEWDGTSWTERARALAVPTERARLVFHKLRNRLVLLSMAGSTWELTEDAVFEQVNPNPFKGGSESNALAYDEARGRIVLYTGQGAEQQIWEYHSVEAP